MLNFSLIRSFNYDKETGMTLLGVGLRAMEEPSSSSKVLRSPYRVGISLTRTQISFSCHGNEEWMKSKYRGRNSGALKTHGGPPVIYNWERMTRSK
jgi:hypothetical protein